MWDKTNELHLEQNIKFLKKVMNKWINKDKTFGYLLLLHPSALHAYSI